MRGAVLTLLVVVAGTVFAAGTAAGNAASPGDSPVPMRTLAWGTTSGMREPLEVVVRDASAWQALWRRHAGASGVPEVDFQREMVVAVFAGAAGTRRTVRITRVDRAGGRLVVLYVLQETRPLPPGEGVPGSAAYHIVAVPRSPLPVVFQRAKTPPVVRTP